MPYLTREQLLTYASDTQRIETARRFRVASASATQATVFLSHSHADMALVQATANYFASQQVVVYVDWLDPTMPSVTSPQTALGLKQRMNGCRKFVVLVTDQSVASRWVPWEVGYADGTKPATAIAALPVVQSLTQPVTEYIGIYSRIEVGSNGGGFVYAPGSTTPSMTLTAWLRR